MRRPVGVKNRLKRILNLSLSLRQFTALELFGREFLEASVSVPKYLADLGIKQVIPPVATSPVLVMGEGFGYGRRLWLWEKAKSKHPWPLLRALLL